MYTSLTLVFTLLPAILAQSTTSCPACDILRGLWDPITNTGSCIGSPSDPVAYIAGFERCLCGTQGQSDYAACVQCKINGEDGVPIDGLNFGSAAGFQTACSIFSSDVTSILKPSGLYAFLNAVAAVATATADTGSEDILGFYIVQNAVSGAASLNTDGAFVTNSASVTATTTGAATAPTSNTAATGTITTSTGSSAAGPHMSGSGTNSLQMTTFLGMLAIPIVASLFEIIFRR